MFEVLTELDRHLAEWSRDLGGWFYVLLFAVIFVETGVVVFPFFPGDSILVAVGSIAALPGSDVDPWLGGAVLVAAAIAGDSTNYWVGRWMGPRVFTSETSRMLNRRHLLRAQRFFERHGGKTVIFSRYLPVIRTFTPFVAGIGAMRYPRFVKFSVLANVLWVATFVPLGYWLARTVPQAQNWVIWGIIGLAVAPPIYSWLRDRCERRREAEAGFRDDQLGR